MAQAVQCKPRFIPDKTTVGSMCINRVSNAVNTFTIAAHAVRESNLPESLQANRKGFVH